MRLSVAGKEIELSRGLLLIMLVALSLIAVGAYDYVEQKNALENAVEVDATVTASEVVTDTSGRGIDYLPNVTYEYRYDGVEYRSDDVYPGSFSASYDVRSEAEAVVDRYPTEEVVTAYVDPSSPGDAFLRRETSSGPFAFVGIGAVILLFAVLKGRANAEPEPSEGERPDDTETGWGTETTKTRTPSEGRGEGRTTFFGFDHDRAGKLLKRSILASFVGLWLSVVGIALVALSFYELSEGTPTTRISPFEPAGFVFVAAFVCGCALIVSVLGYGGWSYSEARRLRRSTDAESRPRRGLASVLFADDDNLTRYERRLRLTVVSFVVGLFLLAVLLNVLGVIP